MGPEGQQGPKVYEFTSEPRILSDYESPNNTDSKWTYVAFGDWSQTIKAADVTVDRTKSRQMGMFTYYLGSDSNYYVEAKERASGSGSQYKYSDGTQVGQNGASKKWFKVEPIVWRVLNKDYAETGTALLLAENILTGGKNGMILIITTRGAIFASGSMVIVVVEHKVTTMEVLASCKQPLPQRHKG